MGNHRDTEYIKNVIDVFDGYEYLFNWNLLPLPTHSLTKKRIEINKFFVLVELLGTKRNFYNFSKFLD